MPAFSLWRVLIVLVATIGYALLWYVSPAAVADELHVWVAVAAAASLAFLFVVPNSVKDSITTTLSHNDREGTPSPAATAYAYRIYSLTLIFASVLILLVFRESTAPHTVSVYAVAPTVFIWFLWTVVEDLIVRLKGVEAVADNVETREDTPLVAIVTAP
ncbi:hypothetical protein DYB30_010207 [Aphanomyces astaci]|uniref:Uncharacterized protein n=1 Tax=Aphanomyces astaci TaxID=112090 RepID=A0A397C733_APHAT|nr:hypothetical protein DYB30_010207 [Aphanomyces astaci]RHY54980.1 hypothetical protein DYB38_009678 [Aphanomyces astaci]RHY72338.1 hypothetical protein DYB34_002534 [Aphanomyces astaci]